MAINFEELSAKDLDLGLSEQKWSSVEVTSYFLERIARINPSVKAIPFVFAKDALTQAQESDERRRQGNVLSLLDGLPMTIKLTLSLFLEAHRRVQPPL